MTSRKPSKKISCGVVENRSKSNPLLLGDRLGDRKLCCILCGLRINVDLHLFTASSLSSLILVLLSLFIATEVLRAYLTVDRLHRVVVLNGPARSPTTSFVMLAQHWRYGLHRGSVLFSGPRASTDVVNFCFYIGTMLLDLIEPTIRH